VAEDTDIVQASIVLVGKFNPAIFSPAWFAKNGIITEGELKVADTQVVHKQVTRFTADHLTISAQPERFTLETTSEPIIRVADMVLQTFRDLLSHTPINAVGINYTEHWRTDTAERRTALARELAPIAPWGAWGASFRAHDVDHVDGMNELVMIQFDAENLKWQRRVEVGPSNEMGDHARGVYVTVNSHREMEIEDGVGAEPIMALLEKEFDPSVLAARKIIADLKSFSQKLELS